MHMQRPLETHDLYSCFPVECRIKHYCLKPAFRIKYYYLKPAFTYNTVLITFSTAVIKYPDKSSFQKSLYWLTGQGTVYHGGMAIGAGGSLVQCICIQEAERNEYSSLYFEGWMCLANQNPAVYSISKYISFTLEHIMMTLQ